MALPDTGITTTLVGTTLGVATRNVGNLCRAESINKWSKWKPVRFNKLEGLTELDYKTATHGMSIPMYTNVQDLVSYYRTNPIEIWGYNRPRGGAYNEFYRLGDFRRYGHEAYKFYDLQQVPDKIFLTSSGVQAGISANGILLDYNMDYECLDKDNSFFGALAVRSGTNSDHIVVTSDDNMGVSPAKSVMIPTSGMVGGFSYDCYAFLCEKSSISPFPIQRYFALEGGYIGTFTVYGSRIKVTVEASKTLDVNNYTVNYTITLENISTDSPVNLNTCSVQVRYADREKTDPLIFGEQQQSLGNITIQPNSTETRSGTFLMVLDDYSAHGGGYVAFYNTSEPTLTGRDYV